MANIKEYNGTAWSTPATNNYIGQFVESALGCFYFYYSSGHIYVQTWNGTAFGSPVDLFSGANGNFRVSYDAGKFYIVYGYQFAEFSARAFLRTWDTSTVSEAVQIIPDFSMQYGITMASALNVAGGHLYFGVYDKTPYTFITRVLKTSHLLLTSGDIVASVDALDNIAIVSVTLSATQTVPGGCSITYSASNNGGASWEAISLNTEHVFTTIGTGLMIKAVLAGTALVEPSIDTWSIAYTPARILSATTHRIAQSIVAGFTGSLGRISIEVLKDGAPGDMTVKIYADNSGAIGTLLSTQVIPASTFLNSYALRTINLDTPVSVTNGNHYWVVAQGAGLSEANRYMLKVKGGNAYANGLLKCSSDSGANYTEYPNEDLVFQTFKGAGNPHSVDIDVSYTKRFY